MDWNEQPLSDEQLKSSRIFYRCVDWNINKRLSELERTVASFTDAWIETWQCVEWPNLCRSHLLQMRGLKLPGLSVRTKILSRIFYRCVDWNDGREYLHHFCIVASFTDAWIETTPESLRITSILVASFTDAWIETYILFYAPPEQRRIFYRCVDWNGDTWVAGKRHIVASFTDAWIETHTYKQVNSYICRIFYRCVDWNLFIIMCTLAYFVASFTDAWIET